MKHSEFLMDFLGRDWECTGAAPSHLRLLNQFFPCIEQAMLGQL